MRNDCLLVRLHVSPVGLKNSNDLTRPRIFCARITLAICLTRLGSGQAGKPKGKGWKVSTAAGDACQDRNSVVPGTKSGALDKRRKARKGAHTHGSPAGQRAVALGASYRNLVWRGGAAVCPEPCMAGSGKARAAHCLAPEAPHGGREKGQAAEAAPWPGSKGIRVLFGRRVRLPDISRIKISQFC